MKEHLITLMQLPLLYDRLSGLFGELPLDRWETERNAAVFSLHSALKNG